jgi:hypothetical protein
VLRYAIDRGRASEYFVVFARDVVPHEVYDIRSLEPSPTDMLLVRFLLQGGTVIWLGNIPFYYVTKPDNGKKPVWLGGGPYSLTYFHVLGFAQVFMDQPQPVTWLSGMKFTKNPGNFLRCCLDCLGIQGSTKISSRIITWLSKRPILIPPELKVEPFHVREAVAECLQRGGFVPLATTYVLNGYIERISADLDFLLKKLENTQTFINRATMLGMGIGTPYISTTQETTTKIGQSQPILAGGESRLDKVLTGFFEAYPAWVRCLGKGMFIRLWDNTIEEKDVDAVASLVDKVARDVLRAKAR